MRSKALAVLAATTLLLFSLPISQAQPASRPAPLLPSSPSPINITRYPPPLSEANGDLSRAITRAYVGLGDRPLNVCISPMDPMVFCDPNKPPSSYTGHDVEMFRAVANNNRITLVEGEDYQFVCTDFDTMMHSMVTPNSTCDIGLGAITINSARDDAGIRFSYPYYRSSLATVVPASARSSDGWAWIRPFDDSLWIAVGVTMVFFPLLLFLVEFGSLKKRVYGSDLPHGIEEATVRSMWTLMAQETLEVSSIGARILALCFAFMALILSSTYTANLAAVLLATSVRSDISDVYDLRGKAVATLPIYEQRLRTQYGILAVGNYNLNADNLDAGFEDVLSGLLSAVIVDEPAARALVSRFPGCTLKTLDRTIQPFDYGIAFAPQLSDAFIDDISESIVKAIESGALSQLQASFIQDPRTNECGEIETESLSIGFQQVWGLWVILASGLGLGLLCMLLTRWSLRKEQDWDLLAQPKDDQEHTDDQEEVQEEEDGHHVDVDDASKAEDRTRNLAHNLTFQRGDSQTFVKSMRWRNKLSFRRKKSDNTKSLGPQVANTGVNVMSGIEEGSREGGLDSGAVYNRPASGSGASVSNKANKNTKDLGGVARVARAAVRIKQSALQEAGTIAGDAPRVWKSRDDMNV